MRIITNKELIEANRKALADGTLIAQALANGADVPIDTDNPCVYRAGNYGCGIGVALTEDELDVVHHDGMNSGTGVDMLVACGYVGFECEGFARALQSYHDNWAGYPDDAALRDDFVRFLDDNSLVPLD